MSRIEEYKKIFETASLAKVKEQMWLPLSVFEPNNKIGIIEKAFNKAGIQENFKRDGYAEVGQQPEVIFFSAVALYQLLASMLDGENRYIFTEKEVEDLFPIIWAVIQNTEHIFASAY